jgi:hypothetical protein
MSGLTTIMTSPQPVSPEKESLGRRIPKALRNAADRLVDSLKIKFCKSREGKTASPKDRRRGS